MPDRRAVGRRGENIACDYLASRGYRILERNARTRYGEIDIVAQRGDCIVFVEVRTVQSQRVMPEESVRARKQRRMAGLAMAYLQRTGRDEWDWQTDVIAVELDKNGQVRRIDHVANAVEDR